MSEHSSSGIEQVKRQPQAPVYAFGLMTLWAAVYVSSPLVAVVGGLALAGSVWYFNTATDDLD